MLGSSTLPVGGAGFEGPDIAKGDDVAPGARLLLFRGTLEGEVSGLMLSVFVGRGCEAGAPTMGPRSACPPRFDIG